MLICIILLLSGSCAYFNYRYHDAIKDNDRLKINEKFYSNGLLFYKTKLGNEVVTTSELTRTIGEFKEDKSNDKLISKVKELNIKIKNLQSATVVTQGIDTVIKDSLIYINNCLTFTRPNTNIKLCRDGATINIRDSLYILEPRRREFVNSRSNIFLIRWFQKKRTVIDLTVSHTNQLLETNDIKKQIIVND